MQVSLVQANRVSAAAILAKTDRIDAQVLCAFGAAMRPPTITASNLEQEHLRELRKPTPSLNSLAGDGAESAARVSDTCVRRLNRSLINQIQKQIEQIDLLDCKSN